MKKSFKTDVFEKIKLLRLTMIAYKNPIPKIVFSEEIQMPIFLNVSNVHSP